MTRNFENQRDVLTSIDSKWAGTSRSRFDYVVDALGRRTSVTQSGSAFADYCTDLVNATPAAIPVLQQFGYNGRSELTQASAYLGSVAAESAKLPNRQYEFAYDNIGNRTSANRTGTPAYAEAYTSNALNQYTARANRSIAFSGTSLASKVVLSGRSSPTPAARQGSYWSDELPVNPSTLPWRGPINVFFGRDGAGANGADLVRTESRIAQTPANPQTFVYDADGNLIDDGLWVYTWDAENRLVRMVTTYQAAAAGFPNRRLQFRYDYLGRRVQKQVYDNASGQLMYGRRYLYDGWNLIGEFAETGTGAIGTLARSYTWGLDIARSLSDAGGVGALLQIADHASGKTYYPGYDGNGNITVLVNSANGAVAAAFEYSPFGEQLRSDTPDPAVADQPFRFSTKYLDQETGLIYYGHRYYNPSMGRWLNLDRAEEKGGSNLYVFIRNAPPNFYDAHGDLPVSFIIAIAGAVGGASGQLFSDLASGNPLDWRNYAVAATTGAAAGLAVIITGPGGQLLLTAANNAVTSMLQQGWTTGEIDETKVVTSVAAGTIMARIPIPGLNQGRNSYKAITQSTTTKAKNRTIQNATAQTAGIMATSAVDGSLLPGVADGFFGLGADWLTGGGQSNSAPSIGNTMTIGAISVSPSTSEQVFTVEGKSVNGGASGKQKRDDDDDGANDETGK